ncbi:MAG TPA: hypothetical protein VFG10_07590 [Saprospiraceae bacterium]|nr:hypothetical protein [Saprospiraceae bacterium]
MSKTSETILNAPLLKPVEDYYRLRREGIGFISQLGSQKWTDYNHHDAGITLLDAFAYASTDLGYRLSWPIVDHLAPEIFGTDTHQPFFTAAKILTVNPWTTDDFRRLLIDLAGVRNAWMHCKECACDVFLYGWCDAKKQLQLGYQKPSGVPENKIVKVQPLGLYEALIELENDPELGDLNDRKIIRKFNQDINNKQEQFEIELRFPEWELLGQHTYDVFVKSMDTPLTITIGKFSRSKTVINSILDIQDLRQYWNGVFYVSFQFTVGVEPIIINNVALRIFGNTAVKNTITVASLLTLLKDGTPTGFIQQYRRKLIITLQQIIAAKAALNSHRNLDEDYCRVKRVDVEDVAVCADIELAPDADIERVQAHIWFKIENYFNPSVNFYTLTELLAEGVAVEEIFNGPSLNNGFIKSDELANAGLKSVLRTSDIINLLMDIDGVKAVNNLLLTKYDAEGQAVRGSADIGTASFKPNKLSAEWTLSITSNHQPRLYHQISNFLFYKNGLPFLPRKDEAFDSLTQLRGEAERLKIKNPQLDIPVPQGQYRNPQDYYPVQYSLPRNYGISPIGLPGNAGNKRIAQARQLKGYLMIFEQLLVNEFAQIANVDKLFSLDFKVDRTYFTREIDNALLLGASDIFKAAFNQNILNSLVETQPEFLKRRNLFLDHILARFGESFGEYALLINNLNGSALAPKKLIDDKISFLNAYPVISHDRARALNVLDHPTSPVSIHPGLKRRINLLLGYPDLDFTWTVTGPVLGVYTVDFELKDGNNTLWLTGSLSVTTADAGKVTTIAFDIIISQMSRLSAYDFIPVPNGFELIVNDSLGSLLAGNQPSFKTIGLAQEMRGELIAWAGQKRVIIVEHLLLRPKFPGDALFPVCVDGDCHTCDIDPYSFRLTFVMPAWNAPYAGNLDMRAFADKTIKMETPSHLLPKICWVGNDGFELDECDPLRILIADVLELKGLTGAGKRPTPKEACDCAKVIYDTYSQVFINWFEDKKLQHFTQDALRFLLDTEFAVVDWTGITCQVIFTPPLIVEIKAIIIDYFIQVAFYGFQFEKFESAWRLWLDANASVGDWTEVRLEEKIEALLLADQLPGIALPSSDQICHCSARILSEYAVLFYQWMADNISIGKEWKDFGPVPDVVISPCTGVSISVAAKQKINDLLVGTPSSPGLYVGWVEVSYRLWIVLDLLGKLRNAYPKATLHDCDDGSDINPVLLNHTALGSH